MKSFSNSLQSLFRTRRSLAIVLAAALCGSYGGAQSLAGLSALSGTVRDTSGGLVVGAEVTVSNPNIGLERKIPTSGDGYFLAPSLPPGPGYAVVVKKDGFAPYTLKNIQLIVGQNITLPVQLSVSQAAESVTVNETAPLVEQTKTGVSTAVESAQIANLPINGRRVDQFALMTPGATTDGASGGVSFRGVPGGNAFLQDGNDVTQQWGLDIAGGSGVPSSISQDAIMEFQVQTSGYSAEFGRAVGGVINSVTKSGTNQFHGTAFWYFRNRTLNATDPYARDLTNRPTNPPEWRHQTGGSIGGPIKKDKLFFFGNVEIMRRNFPLVSAISNSQFYNSAGQFVGSCGAASETTPATPAQCAAAKAYFDRFFQVVPRTANQNLGLGKLDWRPNDKNSLALSFNLLNFESPNGLVTSVAASNGSGVGSNGNVNTKTRTARISHTYIVSNSMVNEARFGWFKDRRSQDINDLLAPPNGLRSGLTVQGQGNLGVSTNLPNTQPSEDRFQYADNLSWTKGSHQLKFGMDIADLRDTENALFNGPGAYNYGSINAFALDYSGTTTGKHWATYTQSFGPLVTHASVVNYALFAQDQWRITPALTLNYGVRYEYSTYTQPPLNTDYPQTGVLNQPGDNFAPRVGLAYAFNNNKTVVRAGYGIFYARLPSASVIRLQQRNGVIQKTGTLSGGDPVQLAAGPVFPNRLTGLAGAAGLTNVTFAANDLATPYTQQGDLSVEHQFGQHTALTVSYMFSRGFKFLSREDLNLKAPTGSVTYNILDVSGNQTGSFTTPVYVAGTGGSNKNDPRYNSIIYISNRGKLWYDGMTVSLRHRANAWMNGTLAYTWSHALDNGLGGAADNIYFTDPPATTYNGNYQFEKGSSRLDQRHRLVVSAIIAPPHRDFGSAWINQAANGWQLGLIQTAASPQYTDSILVVGSSLSPSSNPWASTVTITGIPTGFVGSIRAPFVPRNNVPIDSINRLDARLTKTFNLPWENMNVALSFEVFNVFNNISNTSVFNTAYRANGVNIQAQAGVGNGTASGGFPDGTNARRGQVSARFTF